MKTVSRIAIATPFFGFLLGYFVTNWLMQKDEVVTPNVIGKSLQESVVILSHNNLSVRLLYEQEDSVLPSGTILDQIPKPYQKVKPNQNVFVTVSKRESLAQVPDLSGHQYNDVVAITTKRGIELSAYFITSNLPKGHAIAQYPQAGALFERKRMTVYFSAAQNTLCVMPSFKDHEVKEVEEFLQALNITIEMQQDNPEAQNLRILDQRPQAGSIIDFSHKNTVQLHVVDGAHL